MVAQTKLYTVDEFLAFVQLPENDDRRFELHDGEIVELAPSSNDNTKLGIEIAVFHRLYLRTNDIGAISGADGGYRVGLRKVLMPDVGYISYERGGKEKGTMFPNAPDLAVEIISPSETPSMLRRKVRAYLLAGTKAVWAFDPEDRTASEYRFDDNDQLVVRVFTEDDVLTAEDVLPDFKLTVREVFKVLD
ncbi:MAG: Uma2 family endonuclease [Anaerolineae bacterium]|nr:Uma2 family endonuclease [Anaerolineae bacterium]